MPRSPPREEATRAADATVAMRAAVRSDRSRRVVAPRYAVRHMCRASVPVAVGHRGSALRRCRECCNGNEPFRQCCQSETTELAPLAVLFEPRRRWLDWPCDCFRGLPPDGPRDLGRRVRGVCKATAVVRVGCRCGALSRVQRERAVLGVERNVHIVRRWRRERDHFTVFRLVRTCDGFGEGRRAPPAANGPRRAWMRANNPRVVQTSPCRELGARECGMSTPAHARAAVSSARRA